MHELLKVSKVSKQYGDTTALSPCTFAVQPGKVLGVLGANGAGKTTLFRMIAGMIAPTSGDIFLQGQNVCENSLFAKENTGLLFGGDTGLYDRLTVRENLDYFAQLYGLSFHKRNERIQTLARQLEFTNILDIRAGELSKGMRQKTAISRTLIHDPQLILFDEPTTGLDIASAFAFRDRVRQLEQEGKTILFSTHILDEVMDLCSDVLILDQGKLHFVGSLESLFHHYSHHHLDLILRDIMQGEKAS